MYIKFNVTRFSRRLRKYYVRRGDDDEDDTITVTIIMKTTKGFIGIFGRVRVVAKSAYDLRNICLSVCLCLPHVSARFRIDGVT